MSTGKDTPVTSLLETCKLACDDVTELIEAVYQQLGKEPGAAVRKEDMSFFSLADGVVQALLMRLLRGRVGAIVGEEDEAKINIDGNGPFSAGEIMAPVELEPIIIKLRGRMDALASSIPHAEGLAQLTAFIDPIDGTKEFCSGLGEQSSVCVGVAEMASGEAVGGLIYRPLCAERSWALGCKREGTHRSKLASRPMPSAPAFLCSNGGVSPFLSALQAELGYEAFRAGGAGNKALLLLELSGACYIQDRGVSRWDTCAAEAVIEAHEGLFVRLDVAIDSDVELVSAAGARYSYRKGETNSVFVPGLSKLTKYNAREGVPLGGTATDVAQVKSYANLCGVFALSPAADPKAVRSALKLIASQVAPSYD